MNDKFKELNIADVFTLRYERTAEGYYQQTYTEEEFNTMQEWLDRALGEYTQSMEVENNMLRARNDRLEALTQPEQEPVAFDVQKALRRAYHLGQSYWADADSESYAANKRSDKHRQNFDELCEEALAYTTPPQRTWVGLTDEQMWNAYTGGSDIINLDYAKSIVALFKEKNT